MGNVNDIIFPAPDPSYSWGRDIKGKGYLVNIPHAEETETTSMISSIRKSKYPSEFPWYCLPRRDGSSKIAIYFHGNAEDLGYSYDCFSDISTKLKWHVIAPEYPGYGPWSGQTKSAGEIKRRALSLYLYLHFCFGYRQEDIIIFGRSIGSGAAVWLAAQEDVNPGLLITQSAYTSIKDVAKSISKILVIGLWAIKERFNSISLIKEINWPIFFSHGEEDEVIPYDHSVRLREEARKHNKVIKLHRARRLGHNDMDTKRDVCKPALRFMEERKCTFYSF